MFIVLFLAIGLSGSALAASNFTDFNASGFVVGDSVDNYLNDGTQASPAVDYTNWTPPAWAAIGPRRTGVQADEEIVDIGGSHGKVWRYSTGIEDGSLAQTPKSPHAGFVAGETGAQNDAGMGPVTTNTFFGQFDFRSATMQAQDGMAIRASASSADQRHGYFKIADVGTGLDIDFYNVGTSSYDSVVTDLSYTDWHTVGIGITFNDGPANDVVDVFVNGSSVFSGGSWEPYYTAHAESVDRLSFDIYLNNSFLGGGLYIDNVLISDSIPTGDPIPAPGALILASIGLGCVTKFRKRKAS